MKKHYLLLIGFCIILLQACSTKEEKDYSAIKAIEKQLYAKQTIEDLTLAKELIKLSDAYAKEYKNDPKTAEILYKSAEVCSGIGQYEHAIRTFQQVYLAYPKFNKAAESMFLCGFIYETNLNNIQQASYYYKEFILKYPQHALAKDAQACLDNLGKTPEELVKEFQQKEKAK